MLFIVAASRGIDEATDASLRVTILYPNPHGSASSSSPSSGQHRGFMALLEISWPRCTLLPRRLRLDRVF